MSNRDDIDAAILRLEREADRLSDLQMEATRTATHVGTTREQSRRNDARRERITGRAHDAIVRLRKGIELTDAQRGKLDSNLKRLKSELQSLGETF